MGIYFPNAHLQFYSNNFGWLLSAPIFMPAAAAVSMYLQWRAQCDLCLSKNLAKRAVQLQMDPGAGANSQKQLGHRWKWQPPSTPGKLSS